MSDDPPVFVLLYRIRFDDGGPEEVGALHRGTLAECERVYAAVPAVNYDGPRVPKSCTLVICMEALDGLVRPTNGH